MTSEEFDADVTLIHGTIKSATAILMWYSKLPLTIKRYRAKSELARTKYEEKVGIESCVLWKTSLKGINWSCVSGVFGLRLPDLSKSLTITPRG